MLPLCTPLLLLWLSVGLAQNNLPVIPDGGNCVSKCSKVHEVACRSGCTLAYALMYAPKGYAHNPSCADNCIDWFVQEDERKACVSGCRSFDSTAVAGTTTGSGFLNSVTEFAHTVSKFVQRQFNRLLGNQDASHGESDASGTNPELDEVLQQARSLVQDLQGMDPAEDGHAVYTRLRIIVRSEPDEEGTNVESSDSDNLSKYIGLLALPDGESSVLAPESDPSSPNAVDHRSVCLKFVDRARHIFSNPFNILLALSMVALFILLAAQITLCVLRKPRPQSNSQYARLPTYTEAVEIKIPLDMDSYKFLTEEKPKPEDGNPLA